MKQTLEVSTNQCNGCHEKPEDCLCVRVNVDFPSPNPLCDAIVKPGVVEELLKKGIRLGKFPDPDLRFEYGNDLRETKPNTIAFNRYDDCGIVRQDLLDDPNVLLVAKSHKWSRIKHPKVVLGPSFLYYTCIDRVEEAARSEWPERDIDVCFVGRMHSCPDVSAHRQKCIDLLLDYKAKHPDKNVIAGNHAWEYIGDAYTNLLLRTKVLVSPWGYSPCCYRDWEGLLCGCQVVKPIPSTIDTIPSIYRWHTPLRWCMHNMKDLHSVIDYALDRSFREAIGKVHSTEMLWRRSDYSLARLLNSICCQAFSSPCYTFSKS
jgi:hypothetical protein